MKTNLIQGSTSHKLQRILRQAGIDVFHSAPSKLQGLLHTHKDKPDPNNRAGVYRIPCKVYIGETKRNLPTRLKEHPSTHGTPDASERPSQSSNTTLCHRTSAFSSATFGDQYYRLKDLLYPKFIIHTRLRDRLYPKSTTLHPLCLLTTDSVQ